MESKIIFLLVLPPCILFSQGATDTLWSVPQLDGTICYRPGSGIFNMSTFSSGFSPGDGFDLILGEEVFCRDYLAFDLSSLSNSDTSSIIEIIIGIYQINAWGNDMPHTYPIWNMAGGDTHFCVLDHIDYGNSLDLGDWTAGDLGDPQTLHTNIGIISDNAVVEYKTMDVTQYIKEDIANGQIYNQYRMRFTIDTDFDGLGDLLDFRSGNSIVTKPYLAILMARTPDTAITKEIKPAAAIAWKRIAFGPVRKRGKEIELLDIEPEMAQVLGSEYRFALKNKIPSSGKPLQSVFIDTGENGIFSRGEFEAISAQKQMEFVTPEEIADNIIFEIKGGNTGHDVINALDNATLNPSYRAGYMQHFAVNKMAELEKLSGIDSVAFEMLGPPRLSKLLYEIYLISKIAGSMKSAAVYDAKKLSDGCFKLISEDKELTSRIVSIGIPVLFPDGKTLLRGNDVKIPVQTGNEFLPMDQKTIDIWANDGWVDLRKENMSQWKKRLKALMEEADAISDDDSSSLHVRTKSYWNNYETIDPGRVVSWIFIHEEKGKRIKG